MVQPTGLIERPLHVAGGLLFGRVQPCGLLRYERERVGVVQRLVVSGVYVESCDRPRGAKCRYLTVVPRRWLELQRILLSFGVPRLQQPGRLELPHRIPCCADSVGLTAVSLWPCARLLFGTSGRAQGGIDSPAFERASGRRRTERRSAIHGLDPAGPDPAPKMALSML